MWIIRNQKGKWLNRKNKKLKDIFSKLLKKGIYLESIKIKDNSF